MTGKNLRSVYSCVFPTCWRGKRKAPIWVGWAILLLIALLLVAGRSSPCLAGERLDAATIKAGLRTVTIEEGGYVDRVLYMAAEGYIPYSMIESTFQWARKKPRHKFQYFKHAMETRIAKMQ